MGIRREGDNIILTGKTSVDFLNNILHPNPEQIRKKEEYYQKNIANIKITQIKNGFIAEIPDFEVQLEKL